MEGVKVKRTVRSADRTLDLLELFAREGRPLHVSEIAELLDMPLSSCFGLVRTIQRRGFLAAASRRGALFPTHRFQELAEAFAPAQPLPSAVFDKLEELRDEVDQTVALGHLSHDRVVYLKLYPGSNPLHMGVHVGEEAELHTTAIGKAVLATLPQRRRAAILERHVFRAYNADTITSAQAFERRIARERQRGWHASVFEKFDDFGSIGNSIVIKGVPYAVAIGLQARDFAQPQLKTFVQALNSTCRAIAKATGGSAAH